MEDDQKATAKDSPLTLFIIGLLFMAGAIYVFSQPETISDRRGYTPYLLAVAGLMGVWMTIDNGLSLYATKVRKLEGVEVDQWSGDTLGKGCFGILKWGGLAAMAVLAYNFYTGEFATFRPAEKAIIGLLLGLGYMLFLIAKQLDTVINKLNGRT